MQVSTKSSYESKWDAVGISASLLCGIHCIILPFFLSTLSFLGIELLKNKALEAAMIITSLLVGCWAIILSGYRKRHRRVWPVLLFATGMFLLLSATLWSTSGGREIICKALAAVCIVTAHVFNWKYGRACGVHLARPENNHQ